MSYRLAKLTTYYGPVMRSFNATHAGRSRSSADLMHDLLGLRFGWSDFYQRRLQGLGVDAHEIVANADVVLEAWAREQSINALPEELVVRFLGHVEPDVLFLQDVGYAGRDWIKKIRGRIPSIRLVVGWYCSPVNDPLAAGYGECDVVLCCSPRFVDEMSRMGKRAFLIPHAFEPTLLSELEPNEIPPTDVLFSGSFIPGKGFHEKRTTIVRYLIAQGVPLTIYGNLTDPSTTQLLTQRAGYAAAILLRKIGLERLAWRNRSLSKALMLQNFPRRLPEVEQIATRMRPALYGLDMFRALSRSAVSLNVHGEVAGRFAANVRLFEATGVGSCLVTDRKMNLSEWFVPEQEVVTYDSEEECAEKIKWLLDHPTERAEIARSGQARTLRDHTYEKRAEVLDGIIREHLR